MNHVYVHVDYRVRELYVTHVCVHVSHIQLTYTVISVQDGGGDIYMWELLMCGSSIHV